MHMLLFIAGGVALLLYAVRTLRRGLDRIFGRRLGTWMQRLGDRPVLAFLGGLGAAVIAPSSTTMSLLAVQSVQAGQMTAAQMLRVMLGANIGMTVMVQLIALNQQMLAPLLLTVGVILYLYTKAPRSRGIGEIILSIGLIFIGLGLIQHGVPSNLSGTDLERIISIAASYPLAIAAIACIIAIFMQSSTATIGLAIGLVITGVVGFDIALPVVLGANVGIGVTTLIFGWTQVESRRLAASNLLLKVLIAFLGLLLISPLVALLQGAPGNAGTTVAMAHTGFNVILALVGMPLASIIVRVIARVVPEPAQEAAAFGPRHIRLGAIGDTSIALGQSLRELMHVAEIVRSMLDDIWKALENNDEALAQEVGERDDDVDLLDQEIKRFLTRVVRDEADGSHISEQMRQLRYLAELETIGDIIDKNISELVLKKIRLGVQFSPEGEQELDDFQRRVAENLLIADTAFTTRDRNLAQQLLRHKERLNRDEQRLRDQHFGRLTRGMRQTHETSAIHLDLLTHLRRINSAISHVAYAVLEEDRGADGVERGKGAE